MKPSVRLSLLSVTSLLSFLPSFAHGQQFESLGDAIKKVLGSGNKAFKKKVEGTDVYYTKGADGRASKLAFVEHGIYKPNCSHTWVIGIDAATSKVDGIEVVEMACPHAFPTRDQSYLSQYVGKGPADAKTLIKQIDTIAKATGTCNLTTEAVQRSIATAAKSQGSF